jgi:hypothetical protein
VPSTTMSMDRTDEPITTSAWALLLAITLAASTCLTGCSTAQKASEVSLPLHASSLRPWTATTI